MDKIFLHDEIREILLANGNAWMTTSEIATEVNRRNRYRKRDGSQITDFQIHGRTRNYPNLFEREGSKVRFRKAGKKSSTKSTTEPRVSEVHRELFHYTSMAALEGILKTNMLWATRIDHLNDSSEMELIWPQIKEYCTHCWKEAANSHKKADQDFAEKVACLGGIEVTAEQEGSRIASMLRSSLRGEGRFEHFPPPFIVSFTTHSEDTVQDEHHRSHGMLSQWRGYACDPGVALVFDSRKIEELLEREGERFTLLSCHVVDAVYEEEQDLGERFPDLSQKLREWVDAQARGSQDAELQLPIIEELTPLLISAAARFKHIAFNEEQECRIVVRITSESVREVDVWQEESDKQFKQTHYRPGACGAVPYIRLFEDSGIDLPITRIIVGPSLNQLVYFERIRELVKDRGIAVETSEIPYVGSTT